MTTPFSKFVIQYQTCTATTTGIDQTRTSPELRSDAHRLADAHEQERDQETEHHRQPDVRGGEDDGADERVPEDLVVQDRPEVREPDADALVPDQLEQAVLLEREPDEEVERVPEDQPDRDDDRRDQRVRDGDPSPETATPPGRER